MIKGKLSRIIFCLTLGLFIFVTSCSAIEKPKVETKDEQDDYNKKDIVTADRSTTKKPISGTEDKRVDDSNKDIIMAEIKQHTEESSIVKATAEDAQKMLGYALLIPKYLPERFISYGVYMNEEIVKQIWADTEKLEILYVTQTKSSGKDLEKEIIFTDIMPEGHWSKYRTFYEYTKNGRYVQGFMFVQEDNRTEYDKILKSLKQ